MERYITFILLSIIITYTLQIEMSEPEMKSIKGIFCGNHLADVLSLVCGGVYNSKQKKNVYPNKLMNQIDYNDVHYPYWSKSQAHSIIPIHFRKRSEGVVDECCNKACSFWEMKGYCGKK